MITVQRHSIQSILLLLLASTSLSALNNKAGHPNFLSPHFNPIALDDKGYVFVVNTPNDTLDIISVDTGTVIKSVAVGIDPVGLALKPDFSQIWVTNHVSDSINVIENNPDSPMYWQIIATIQDIDPVTKATRFDEPVGIAFANNEKAYITLSSENQVAVIDTNDYSIIKKIRINAQDPRGIVVKGNRLYVIPFESNNRTQISGCVTPFDLDLCTFDATEHVVTNNNVLSLGIVVDIVKHPDIPDRDLFIYDTENEQHIKTISGVGTLLYGLTVDNNGHVFVAQTDARNHINGAAGTFADGLTEMENRAFLNQITQIDCSTAVCDLPQLIELEPKPPQHPTQDQAVATPFAIEVSNDDKTLFLTAAGSNQLVILDAVNQNIISRVNVGKVPRGVKIQYDNNEKPKTAWVMNAVENSVSKVDISDLSQPQLLSTIPLTDPTHPQVKLGRIQFNDAKASTTGTFSCESCHPDGGTDQLLWVLDTPKCSVTGCNQIPPRITMPIRGLRDTAPYHWDGIPGDPYGGSNTANIFGSSPANCVLENPESCTRNLVDGGLATTMCRVGFCPTNEEGKAGALTAQERNAMAKFLLSIPYPPAQRRAFTNELSQQAEKGFSLFHIEGDLQGNPEPNVCGDCHRMPFWVSTNTPGTGMDAPTWRGAYDRWLILPQGRLNIIGFPFYEILTRLGVIEENMWRLSWASRFRFNPVWNMVTEGSTGFSGAFGRQVTLNKQTIQDSQTNELLSALELAASDSGILLQGTGVIKSNSTITETEIYYQNRNYWFSHDNSYHTKQDLIAMINNELLMATLTAKTGHKVDVDHPQPALWTLSSMHLQTGRQIFPTIPANSNTMTISGRHIQPGALVWLDGKRVPGIVKCRQGSLPQCIDEKIEVKLGILPKEAGLHFLQVQNQSGLFSNDFIFHTVETNSGHYADDLSGPWFNSNQSGHGWYFEHLPSNETNQTERLLAYWYTFKDGSPVWLVGSGEIINGKVQMLMTTTQGGNFPPNFVSQEIVATDWGLMEFEFVDNNAGKATWHSEMPGYSSDTMYIEKLANISNSPSACLSGSYYNMEQSGHGIGIQIVNTGQSNQILVAWYTYLDGVQTWLVGQAPFDDNNASVNMYILNGGNFPPEFDSDELQMNDWGTLTINFNNENQANISWNSDLTAFGSGELSMQRITYLKGHPCQ